MEFELKNAFEHIDKLAYEIGPRIAGTRGEKVAAEYISEKFRGFGLEVSVHPFKFRKRSTVMKTAGAIFAISFVATIFLPPDFSLVLWAAALILGGLTKWLVPSKESQNIIAKRSVRESKKKIVLTAHYDTAMCIGARGLHLFHRFGMKPLLALVTFLLILRFGGLIPQWWQAWIVSAVFFLPVCISPFLMIKGRSPGADDNASGVAVMLECARVLTEKWELDQDVSFVAFGAEEQGLAGSKQFAKKRLPKDAVVLNIDTVGREELLAIVEGNGILKKIKTDTRMNTVLEELIREEGLRPVYLWAALALHDHVPLIRAGMRATTLSSSGNRGDGLGRFIGKIIGRPNTVGWIHSHIHTPQDLPDYISPDNIERAGKIVLKFVEKI